MIVAGKNALDNIFALIIKYFTGISKKDFLNFFSLRLQQNMMENREDDSEDLDDKKLIK